MPRLKGSRRTRAPAARASSPVRADEPSSPTTISSPASWARISAMTRAIARSSSSAGTTAMRRGSAMCRHGFEDADQLEQLPRPVRVRVLVERALPRPAPELLGLSRVGEQLAVHGGCLLGDRDDEQLAPRLEPALDTVRRI